LTALTAFAQRPQPKSQDEQIRQVADAYEGLMLQHLQDQMRKSQGLMDAGEDNPFAPSHAEQVYRAMLQEHIAKDMAKRRPLGVGTLVERQLRGQIGIGRRATLVESK
jgi:Rod binding domain-containing protein